MAISEGARNVLVIGTDCPELDTATLVEAFDRLAQRILFLGPAADGGYYLIGLNGKRPELFREIELGTDRVLRQSLVRARQSRCKVHQLRALSDVDYPEDLLACRRLPTEFWDLAEVENRSASIIVPTLNEARTIEQTLPPLVG